MIGKIKGTLSEVYGNEGLIETQSGVYYKVFMNPDSLNKIGKTIEIHTFLNVKEDELSLYGFDTRESYTLFTMLKSVDGVGPKTAFGIVNSTSSGELRKAVQQSDVSFFQSIKGIGKKTAQKILLELSGKLGEEFDLSLTTENQEDKDAIDALVALGFTISEARKALIKIDKKMSLEDRVKTALMNLT